MAGPGSLDPANPTMLVAHDLSTSNYTYDTVNPRYIYFSFVAVQDGYIGFDTYLSTLADGTVPDDLVVQLVPVNAGWPGAGNGAVGSRLSYYGPVTVGQRIDFVAIAVRVDFELGEIISVPVILKVRVSDYVVGASEWVTPTETVQHVWANGTGQPPYGYSIKPSVAGVSYIESYLAPQAKAVVNGGLLTTYSTIDLPGGSPAEISQSVANDIWDATRKSYYNGGLPAAPVEYDGYAGSFTASGRIGSDFTWSEISQAYQQTFGYPPGRYEVANSYIYGNCRPDHIQETSPPELPPPAEGYSRELDPDDRMITKLEVALNFLQYDQCYYYGHGYDERGYTLPPPPRHVVEQYFGDGVRPKVQIYARLTGTAPDWGPQRGTVADTQYPTLRYQSIKIGAAGPESWVNGATLIGEHEFEPGALQGPWWEIPSSLVAQAYDDVAAEVDDKMMAGVSLLVLLPHQLDPVAPFRMFPANQAPGSPGGPYLQQTRALVARSSVSIAVRATIRGRRYRDIGQPPIWEPDPSEIVGTPETNSRRFTSPF